MLRPWIPKSRTKCSKIKPKIREDRRENQAAAACLLLFKILTDWTAKEDGEKMCEKRMLRTESTNELWRIETLRRLRQIKKKYGIFGLKKQKVFFVHLSPYSDMRYTRGKVSFILFNPISTQKRKTNTIETFYL